ncbi:MAG: sigma-70 region 4 domain-containing protein, partial [Bacteroidaceae bacterium]|nr:sigma-70 region 4 domain-containing protein [Bacteroidaceae bacterium]
EKIEISSCQSDRFDQFSASLYVEEYTMSKDDIEVILGLMPNKRYSMIIRLRYIEGMSNEETASALQMSMDNFYNKHMRAKKQFNEIVKKEGQYGKIF